MAGQKLRDAVPAGFVLLGEVVIFIDEEAKTLNLGVNLTSVTFSDQQVTLQGGS